MWGFSALHFTILAAIFFSLFINTGESRASPSDSAVDSDSPSNTESTIGTPKTSETARSPTKNEVAALGRSAEMGELYNAITDSFLGYSIFNQTLPTDAITTTKNPWTSSKYTMSDNIDDVKYLLGLKIELVASALMGMLTVTGSASYLFETTTTKKAARAFMDWQTRTEKDSIQPLYDNIRAMMSMDLLENAEATHIVCGIEYGGDLVVKFEDYDWKTVFRLEAEYELKLAVNLIVLEIEAKAKVTVSPRFVFTPQNTVIQIYGDMTIPGNYPSTFSELRQFIAKVPGLIGQFNGGKGKAMMYTLCPLNIIRAKMNVTAAKGVPQKVTPIDPRIFREIIQVAQTQQQVRGQFREMQESFQANTGAGCLAEEHVEKLSALQKSFEKEVKRFQKLVRKLLIDIRRGISDQADFDDLKVNYMNRIWSPDSVSEKLGTDFTVPIEKIRICEMFTKASSSGLSDPVEYITRASDLRSFQLKHSRSNIFVLFYKFEMISRDEKTWSDQIRAFFHSSKNPGNKMAVVDCEFPAAGCFALGITKVTFRHYKNGQLISDSTRKEQNKVKVELPAKIYKTLEIPALGTTQNLGSLYNADTREFLGQFLQDSQSTLPTVNTDVDPKFENSILFPRQSLTSKLKALQIPPKAQIRYLVGDKNVVPASESLQRYLDVNDEDSSLSAGFISTLRTFKESFQISSPSFLNAINLERAKEVGATHFVQTVFYGTTSIFELRYPGINGSPGEQAKIYRDLEELKTFYSHVFKPTEPGEGKGPVGFEIDAVLAPFASETVVKVYSDVTMDREIFDTGGSNGIQEFILNLRMAYGSQNDGKGTQVGYILLPLSSLNDVKSTKDRENPGSIPSPDFGDAKNFIEHFREIEQAEKSILTSLFSFESSSCALKELVQETSRIFTKVMEKKKTWISKLRLALENGTIGNSSDFLVLGQEVTTQLSMQLVVKSLEENLQSKHPFLLEKFKLCKIVTAEGVGFLNGGPNAVLDESFWRRNGQALVYLLFFKQRWTSGKDWTEAWTKVISTFFTYLNRADTRGFFVDCDSPAHQAVCESFNRPVIQEHNKGLLTSGRSGLPQNFGISTTLDKKSLCLEYRLDGIKRWLENDLEETVRRARNLVDEFCPLNVTTGKFNHGGESQDKLWGSCTDQ